MENKKALLRLHLRASLFLKVYLKAEETISHQKKEYKKFLNADKQDKKWIFYKDSDFTDIIDEAESIKKRVIEKYDSVMRNLYNPDYCKTENLWQSLAAINLLLEHKGKIDTEFIEEIKKVLNDNRP